MSAKMRSMIVGLLLAFGVTGAAFCQDVAWRKVLEIKDKNTYIAAFNNEEHGIMAGYGGAVWFTKDSGQTWKKGANISMCRFGLEIVDDNTAFNCGNGGGNRVTVDGGRNWDKMADFGMSEPAHCRFLSFIDGKTGWIGSAMLLASTDDRGANWNKIQKPDGMGQIAAIDLFQPKAGFVLNSKGSLYATVDGGAAWTSKPIVLAGSSFAFTSNRTAANALQFKNPREGTIVAYRTEPKKAWVALTTADAGDSWKVEEITDAVDPASAIYFSNDGRFVTLYDNSKVISVFKRGD